MILDHHDMIMRIILVVVIITMTIMNSHSSFQILVFED